MDKLKVGKTYKYVDDDRYIRVLKHLQKYETYLCDTVYLGKKSRSAYACRIAVEYDEIFLWEETEDDFDEKFSLVPEQNRSHALKTIK